MALAFFAMQPNAAQAKTKKAAKVEKQLVVLHTNDTHSCVMPINPNLADTAMANRGGYLRRVAMIKQERKANRLAALRQWRFLAGIPLLFTLQGRCRGRVDERDEV